MAELGVAASVVGIIVPALHGVRLLLDDVQSLKDVSKTIKRLSDEARSLESALTTLQAVGDQDWESLGSLVAQESKTTISTCTSACEQFRTELKHWTRHSEDGKLALTDRARVALLKQGPVKTMSEQLQNCKLSVTSIVGVANLYSSIRHTHMTEDIRHMISARQTEVSNAITTADRQLVVVDSRLAELSLSDDDDDNVEDAEQRANALRQLEEERKALDSSRKLLEELLSKSQEEAVARAAGDKHGGPTVTFGTNYGGFQANTYTVNGGVSNMTFGRK